MAVRDHEVLRTHVALHLSTSFQRAGRLSVVSVLALGASACGGGAGLATAPTRAPGVVTTLSPTPVTLRRAAGAQGFQLAGDAVFRNGGGVALRLVSLDVELADAVGARDRQPLAVDLTLAAGQTVSRPLADMVVTRSIGDPVRMTITARALAADGQAIDLEPAGAPVVVVAPTSTAVSSAPVTFVGAGDIADCRLSGADATARLLDGIAGDVFTLGDHVYPSATTEGFAGCYASTWGRHRSRTHPTPGNHEWEVSGGAPYFGYFGGAASGGFYSFNLGAWHVLSLNSNVSAEPGSAQYEWARADLAANPVPCTIAYWHHPLFSSGPNGNNSQMRSMWRLLDAAGADVVLVGHDHLYERFAPQDADGRPTPSGMRQFTVGTGGAQPYGAVSLQANSEVRVEQTWGVLKLTLRSNSYDWEFLAAGGLGPRDAGASPCTP